MVDQKPGLLIGRVKDVVRYGNENLSDAEVAEVLQAAQASEFVSRLPGGVDEWVSSGAGGGDTLSGGQGQRLALARALGRKPRVLVLDEATSALDTETESKLRLVGDWGGTTGLIIAHRLGTVRGCDNVVVVKGGRVVREGSGEECVKSRRRMKVSVSHSNYRSFARFLKNLTDVFRGEGEMVGDVDDEGDGGFSDAGM